MPEPQPPAQTAAGQTPEIIYQQRCAEFGALRDRYGRRSYRNANLSLALIAAALACLGLWLWRGTPALLVVAGLLALGFVISFINHGRVDQTLRRYAELFAINAEGDQRLRRDWAALPLRQPRDQHAAEGGARAGFQQLLAPFAVLQTSARQAAAPAAAVKAQPAFATDLDVLGHASLQHLLNTPATPVGLATLRDWLLAPATPAVARRRQSAVAELAPLIELRDQFALRGRLLDGAQRDYERFAGWAERAPWLPRHGWLLMLARALPLVTLALAAMQLAGLIAAPLWLGGIVVGLLVSQTVGRAVDRTIDEAAERQAVFATYAELFGLLNGQPFDAPELRRLHADLGAAGLRAEHQMRRLSRLMALADLRGWMFFYPIQLATLWNVHVLWLLERWQRAAGASARRWLAVLGEFEALAALATLAHDNPGWIFPELIELQSAVVDPRSAMIDPRRSAKEREEGLGVLTRKTPERPQELGVSAGALANHTLQARGLGHPLLPPAACVGNDLAIGPTGQFLLVTGSNMSGKSTLLRAIGLNVVLAQAGGPVCAATLRLPPIVLATSIRVQDSLEQGVSYFMAELQRLKEVVDLAEGIHRQGDRIALFLLDEILHGTNSSERQIAARRIILHLLSLGATGAVSTHDLTLADAPDLAAASQVVHFTEQFTRDAAGLTMRFDYRLRAGIATSTNALKLMEMLGLPTEQADPETRRHGDKLTQ